MGEAVNNGASGGPPTGKAAELQEQTERIHAVSEELQRRQRLHILSTTEAKPDWRTFVCEILGLEPFLVQQLVRHRTLTHLAKFAGIDPSNMEALTELEKALMDQGEQREITKVSTAYLEGMAFAALLERQTGDAGARAAELRLVKENLHEWGVNRDIHDIVEGNIDARIAELEGKGEQVEGEAVDEPPA